MVWLSMFRIVSPRMSRRRHMFTFLIYVSLEPVAVIQELIAFSAIMNPPWTGAYSTSPMTKPSRSPISFTMPKPIFISPAYGPLKQTITRPAAKTIWPRQKDPRARTRSTGPDSRRKTGDHGIFHPPHPLGQDVLLMVFFLDHAGLGQADHEGRCSVYLSCRIDPDISSPGKGPGDDRIRRCRNAAAPSDKAVGQLLLKGQGCFGGKHIGFDA